MTSRVLIKSDGKVFLVKQQEIDFVEAAGNYANVCLGSVSLFTRSSLNRLAALLSPDRFVRIHRSAIVNLDQVVHLVPQPGGEYLLTLRRGKQLKASRRHVGQLTEIHEGSGPRGRSARLGGELSKAAGQLTQPDSRVSRAIPAREDRRMVDCISDGCGN